MRAPASIASSVLAALPADAGAAVVRRGDTIVVGAAPAEVIAVSGSAAPAALATLGAGFWVGCCSFELGHALERVETRSASREVPLVPDVLFARFDALAEIAPDGAVSVRGIGPGRDLLAAAVARPAVPAALGASGPWRSGLDRDGYEARVEAILELLRAGECYQVNLTRRLTCAGALDPVALHAALAEAHPAPHAGMLRLLVEGRRLAVVSASPEGFLRRRGDLVETRPIKGTAADPRVLRASAKDHAENVMIVDLARNDLGRVCEPGSISVPSLCTVEAHPGLHHLVSTVRGRLRPGVDTGALVAATFPPASVTGAPKPRVLNVIEELEPVRRGVYCGAFGWIDTERDEADLAVAIRTFTVHGEGNHGCTQLGVGGGIVADSEPGAEWEETELKAARLLAVAGAGLGAGVGAGLDALVAR